MLNKPADVLGKVVTDEYFREASHSLNDWLDNKDNDLLAFKAKQDIEMARATAWVFVYYVVQMRKEFSLLQRYGEELDQLPRDLDLDVRALQGCFARGFKLSDLRDINRLDANRLASLAEAWFNDVGALNLEDVQIERMYLEQRTEDAKRLSTPPTPPAPAAP
jgi:hypothetical protein